MILPVCRFTYFNPFLNSFVCILMLRMNFSNFSESMIFTFSFLLYYGKSSTKFPIMEVLTKKVTINFAYSPKTTTFAFVLENNVEAFRYYLVLKSRQFQHTKIIDKNGSYACVCYIHLSALIGDYILT